VCTGMTIVPGGTVRSDDEYQDPGRRGRYAEGLSLSRRPLKPSSVNAIAGGESGPARQHPQFFFRGFSFSLPLSLRVPVSIVSRLRVARGLRYESLISRSRSNFRVVSLPPASTSTTPRRSELIRTSARQTAEVG